MAQAPPPSPVQACKACGGLPAQGQGQPAHARHCRRRLQPAETRPQSRTARSVGPAGTAHGPPTIPGGESRLGHRPQPRCPTAESRHDVACVPLAATCAHSSSGCTRNRSAAVARRLLSGHGSPRPDAVLGTSPPPTPPPPPRPPADPTSAAVRWRDVARGGATAPGPDRTACAMMEPTSGPVSAARCWERGIPHTGVPGPARIATPTVGHLAVPRRQAVLGRPTSWQADVPGRLLVLSVGEGAGAGPGAGAVVGAGALRVQVGRKGAKGGRGAGGPQSETPAAPDATRPRLAISIRPAVRFMLRTPADGPRPRRLVRPRAAEDAPGTRGHIAKITPGRGGMPAGQEPGRPRGPLE